MNLLCLDLSTTSTGWAYFQNGKLKASGAIKPQVKGISALKYPAGAYHRIIDLSNKIKDLVAEKDPDVILIEEVNRGVNRISQKSLDALHFFVLDRFLLISENALKKCKYMDSNGKKGWRTVLGMKLDDQDKEYNKQAREFNKDNKAAIKRGDKIEKDIIGWKHLSVRHANKKLKLDLNVDTAGDEDIADAICMGLAYIQLTNK